MRFRPLCFTVLLLLPLATAAAGPTAGSGFGGPTLKWESIDGRSALLIGGEGSGGIEFGRHLWTFGGGGSGIVPSLDITDDRQLSFAYGGFIAGYLYRPGGRFFWDSRLLLGGGTVWLSDADGRSLAKDDVLVAEGRVGVGVYLSRYSALGLGLYRRQTTDPPELLDDNLLNNWGLVLSLDVGLL